MSDSLIPPSITGKGSHFPPGGSVLERWAASHRSRASFSVPTSP